MFFAYNKILGRTEARTRDRMYCHSMRTVRDSSRDDRARIATCSLLTPTDLWRIVVYMLSLSISIYYVDVDKVFFCVAKKVDVCLLISQV